jgi:hypothetical protein
LASSWRRNSARNHFHGSVNDVPWVVKQRVEALGQRRIQSSYLLLVGHVERQGRNADAPKRFCILAPSDAGVHVPTELG